MSKHWRKPVGLSGKAWIPPEVWYSRGLMLNLAQKNSLGHCVPPSHTLYKGLKLPNLAGISDFSCLWVAMVSKYSNILWKLNKTCQASMMDLYPSQIGYSLGYTTIWELPVWAMQLSEPSGSFQFGLHNHLGPSSLGYATLITIWELAAPIKNGQENL